MLISSPLSEPETFGKESHRETVRGYDILSIVLRGCFGVVLCVCVCVSMDLT